MENTEIEKLKEQFVRHLAPEKIYLFGSFASGTYTDESDYDFYIIVGDDRTDMANLTTIAYQSVRSIKKRPVDIVVGTRSRFENRKKFASLEYEVFNKGVLLYDESGSEIVA